MSCHEIKEGDNAVITVEGDSSKKDFPLQLNIAYGDGYYEIKDAQDLYPNDPENNLYAVVFLHVYNKKGEYTISAEAVDKSGLKSKPITCTIKVSEKESINLEKINAVLTKFTMFPNVIKNIFLLVIN